MQETWIETSDAIRASESWDQFVLECAVNELWCKLPVYAVDNIVERIRYLTGDPGDYAGFWVDEVDGSLWL